MAERIDFSRNASVYDRRHGAAIPDDAVDRLWTAARVTPGTRLLDIAAGTGRVAIPFRLRGCEVTAVEPAPGMLAQLQEKSAKTVLTVAAEGAHLPFPTGAFDVVVIARLLYLTVDWRAILDEAHRVLADGGALLHEWGNGQDEEEWVRIREEARRLFLEAGVQAPFHPGVRSEDSVDEYLKQLCFVRDGAIELGPGPATTLREFLRRLVDGELSYIWNVPDDVRADCLPKLQHWSEQTFDLDRPIAVPRRMRWTIFRKQ